jgi:uridylate kinase
METIVMSVGGSLIVPDAINIEFLKRLKLLVEVEIIERDRRFIIIAGGGRTARNYQDAARAITGLERDDIDWIGIHATRLNGHLLRTVFKDIAHPVIVTNPDDVLDAPEDTKLIIAAGYRPGASTDLCAIQIAERVGATKVVNLSNTDYIMTSDPKKVPYAKKIEDITWADFRKLIPEEWDPGLSSPFDPVAAREADKLGIEVASINGNYITSLTNYLGNRPFVGTRIHT